MIGTRERIITILARSKPKIKGMKIEELTGI
jgi:hypothetical protein